LYHALTGLSAFLERPCVLYPPQKEHVASVLRSRSSITAVVLTDHPDDDDSYHIKRSSLLPLIEGLCSLDSSSRQWCNQVPAYHQHSASQTTSTFHKLGVCRSLQFREQQMFVTYPVRDKVTCDTCLQLHLYGMMTNVCKHADNHT